MTRDFSQAVRLDNGLQAWPSVREAMASVPRETFDYVWIIDGPAPAVERSALIGTFGRTTLLGLR